ncbi:hypothetical protein VP01_1741g1 [Puccinia sorghi]|uniref:Uncharacterized protein n=1 Tax=Puccinia sorghi TaxID=27349 RepID=A0A0L6VF39_9BASI|nr:hypothetical protein VP01_1741g1 [Puccinia sorghi]
MKPPLPLLLGYSLRPSGKMETSAPSKFLDLRSSIYLYCFSTAGIVSVSDIGRWSCVTCSGGGLLHGCSSLDIYDPTKWIRREAQNGRNFIVVTGPRWLGRQLWRIRLHFLLSMGNHFHLTNQELNLQSFFLILFPDHQFSFLFVVLFKYLEYARGTSVGSQVRGELTSIK